MIRNRIEKIVVLAAVCAVSSACAVHVQHAGQPAVEARAIRAVLDSTAAGWNRGELATYMGAYVDTATAMGRNGVDHGAASIEAGMKAGFWKTGRPLQTLHYESVDVRFLGPDHALVTGKFVLTGGGRPDQTGWFTTVWAHVSQGWRMMHDHSS